MQSSIQRNGVTDMTGRQLFDRTVYILCRRHRDFYLELDYPMDEELTEGYTINIPRVLFNKKHVDLLDEECFAMLLKMKVRYTNLIDHVPVEITFYAGEYETPIIMYRLNFHLTNIYGINRVLTEDTYLVSVVKKIVLPTFRSFSKAICIKLLERME